MKLKNIEPIYAIYDHPNHVYFHGTVDDIIEYIREQEWAVGVEISWCDTLADHGLTFKAIN